MRILFLLNRYPGVGGIENITTLLAELFKSELKYQTSIFSLVQQDNIDIPFSIRQAQIPVVIAKYDNKSDVIHEFSKHLENFRPDVVIFQDSYAEIEYLLSYIDKNVKIYVVEHNTPDCLLKGYLNQYKQHKWLSLGGAIKKILFPVIYTQLWWHQRKRHKALVQMSDKYILLSDSYKKILKSYYNIGSDKILAIPNIKNEFDIKTDITLTKKKQVLFVGRLSSQKGIDKLMEIWRRIETLVLDYELVIVGDGEDRKIIEESILKYNLKRIRLEGFREDVDKYYKESSALFMTSNFEGFPLVLSEAMQFGVVPFVYDTFTSLHDIIESNKNGYIIKPFDIRTYVNYFLFFIKKPQNEVFDIRLSAIKSSENFSTDVVLAKWLSLFKLTYEDCLSN